LHDVLAGDTSMVFRYTPSDPHPISYLRVLLGVEMCRHFYGAGPWDALEASWLNLHSGERAEAEPRRLAEASRPHLKRVTVLALDTPMKAFHASPLRALIAPERVSPTALDELDARIGPALFTSAHWLWSEPLRALSLTGLQFAIKPQSVIPILELQRQSMLRLGGALQAA
jgi:hypothetical protein